MRRSSSSAATRRLRTTKAHGRGLSTRAALQTVIATAPIKTDDDPAEAERLKAEIDRELRRLRKRSR